MKEYILGVDELKSLVQDVYEILPQGVVILQGDLAAGKTTFVKAFSASLGVKEDVTSPTFSLQQCYAKDIFHYDIYNHGLDHFISLGMLEELEKEGLHFVEWGDDGLVAILVAAEIPFVLISIEKTSHNKRKYRIDNAQV